MQDDLASRQKRCSIFVDWIMEKFPEVFDRDDDSLIVDVAGGPKAELGFEFARRRLESPRVVVIDPRGDPESEIRRPKWKERLLKKQQGTQHQAFEVVSAHFDRDLLSSLSSTEGRRRISLLTAMHPDEATEAVVDVGLEAGIPFAVVPCCVFSEMFPQRRMKKSGREPTSYEEFCEYLSEKEDKIRRENLGFHGKDSVLYWKGREMSH